MDGSVGTDGLLAELDAAHDRAHQAFARRDVGGYVAMFHPDLEYTQHDGRTIDRERLARDVRTQLARVYRATTEYRREALEALTGSTAREVLEQHATFEVRAFVFLHREWAVRRRGRYEWARTASGWQIRRVEVLEEEATSRIWLGLD